MKMKVIAIIIISFNLFCNQLKSQTDTIAYTVLPDSMPTFIYGQEQYGRFVVTNINYPSAAKAKKVEGKVYISFIVDTMGAVIDPVVMRDIGEGCGQEAKRIIQLTSGLWKPGIYNGKLVNVKMTMPIKFTCTNCEVIKGAGSIEFKPNADYFYNKGISEFNANRPLTAIFYFSQALERNPKHLDALYNRGIAKFKNNDTKGACEDWNKGKALGDKNVYELIETKCK